MTSWNYRIVRYKHGAYGLHEVYYDEEGVITGRTENPCSFACDEEEGPEGVISSLEMALKDAKEKAVVQDPTNCRYPNQDQHGQGSSGMG